MNRKHAFFLTTLVGLALAAAVASLAAAARESRPHDRNADGKPAQEIVSQKSIEREPIDRPKSTRLSTDTTKLTPFDTVSLEVPYRDQIYNLMISLSSSATQIPGRADGHRAHAGELVIEPTLAPRQLQARLVTIDERGEKRRLRMEFDLFGSGDDEKRALEQVMMERYGQRFNISMPSITSIDLSICDGDRELVHIAQDGRFTGTLSVNKEVDSRTAAELLTAEEADSLTVRWWYTVETRKRSGARSDSLWVAQATQTVENKLNERGADNVFDAHQAEDFLRKLNAGVSVSVEGDRELFQYLTERPFRIEDVFEQLPEASWGALSEQQRHDVERLLSKTWGARLSDQETADHKLTEKVEASSATSTSGGGFIFFSATDTDTKAKVDSTTQQYGIVMKKVEGGNYWYPFAIRRFALSREKADVTLRHRQSIIMDGDATLVTLAGTPSTAWVRADALAKSLKQVAEKSDQRVKLLNEQVQLIREIGEIQKALEESRQRVAARFIADQTTKAELDVQNLIPSIQRFAECAAVVQRIEAFREWSEHLQRIGRLAGISANDVFLEWLRGDSRDAAHQQDINRKSAEFAALESFAVLLKDLFSTAKAEATTQQKLLQDLSGKLDRLRTINAALNPSPVESTHNAAL